MAEAILRVATIGFGEAAMAFVEGMGGVRPALRAYDSKTDAPATRATKRADYEHWGVDGRDSAKDAIENAALILSLVTADQALAAAQAASAALARDSIYCDMNSVAPETKRAAAAAIEAAGGRYADVAVMAPVRTALMSVSLLVSGPHAEAAARALRAIGFANLKIVAGPVGAASAIKMIRSVMIKGIEALSAECFLAASAAGVTEAVVASLDASWPGANWRRRSDYNLDRIMIHGLRRATEMEEVAKTLDALGAGSAMARATIEAQRAIGRLNLAPPDGLEAKTALILARKAQAA